MEQEPRQGHDGDALHPVHVIGHAVPVQGGLQEGGVPVHVPDQHRHFLVGVALLLRQAEKLCRGEGGLVELVEA